MSVSQCIYNVIPDAAMFKTVIDKAQTAGFNHRLKKNTGIVDDLSTL